MARKELAKSKAEEYRKASKRRKGEILDALCENTGWSRDNARRQLKRALTKRDEKKTKRRRLKYSDRARQVLTNAWVLAGTPCGQYLAWMIKDGLLERLTKTKSLKDSRKNSGADVLADDPAVKEIKQMSSATIDRYLKDPRRKLEPLSKATTKQSTSPLRDEIPFGKSYAGVDRVGYLSTDTVAHCGNTMKGDHIWTLNSTDVQSGWSVTASIPGRARKWIKEGHEHILASMPFAVIAVNYDGGSEFINYEMMDYSVLHNYQMTRSRPYHKNDNAHIEQKNFDIVRRHAFRYRYEGSAALRLLNELWYWVGLRKNFLMPTRKRIGHTTTKSGRTRGVYDKPKTPYRRLMESQFVTKATKKELTKVYQSLNDAEITKAINRLQLELLELVTDKNLLEYISEVIEALQVA